MSGKSTGGAAHERDALPQAAIDFIGTLTGMTPPPIEVAPPEVFAPFRAFVDRVQAITALTTAAAVPAATRHAENAALLADILNRRPAINAGLVEAYACWTQEVYDLMGAMAAEPANDSSLAAAPKAEPVPTDHFPDAGEMVAGTHIQQPYSLAEIKAKIASNDYSAELLLQHAMLLLEKPDAVAGPREAVAYLDIGGGGYLDLGSDLSDEALRKLPKGRNMLAIVGTYGVDGYVPVATPTTQAARPVVEAVDALIAAATLEGGVSLHRTAQARAETEARKAELLTLIAPAAVAGPSDPSLDLIHAMESAWHDISHDSSITTEAKWLRFYRRVFSAAPTTQAAPGTGPNETIQAAVDALIRAAWSWGEGCGVDSVPWGAEGDSHNEMQRGEVDAAKRHLLSVLATQAAPVAKLDQDDLYWRLHSLSKSLEGSGRLDDHDNPDAYATILDAMNAVRSTAPVEQGDAKDPLAGAAQWLLQAIDGCNIGVLQSHLKIGFNRAERLMQDALVARSQAKEGGTP